MKHLREWFAAGPSAAWVGGASAGELLSAFGDLTPAEAHALAGRRVDVLYGMSIHPMSIVQMSRVFGFDLKRRWRELSEESK
jgi:hypothetical protein